MVREGRRTGEIQVRLVDRARRQARLGRRWSDAAPTADGLLWTQARRASPRPPRAARPTLLSGVEQLEEELGGLSISISGEAFFQTNTEMAERLYALAIEYAELKGYERLYDLYCGIGTIGLLMAPRVAELWGLEIVEDAIADAIAERAPQRDRQRALLRR